MYPFNDVAIKSQKKYGSINMDLNFNSDQKLYKKYPMRMVNEQMTNIAIPIL